ncbi:MAG: hypothetical protein KDJ52_35045, partial [Anaerolineae bacterium]|nr:hypothetical protein [Anaerolineae bacterium]
MGKVLTYRPLADALQTDVIVLGAMNGTDLARAIEFEPEVKTVATWASLVDRILADVGDDPGQLPLLEFALTQLWRRQSGGHLTKTAYQAIGRVPGAVTRYAEQVYAGLSSIQQHQARHIFTQLVQPGAGTEDTRRVACAAELEADWSLVQHLADRRLVITNQDAGGGETVEIVHEALIQNWQRLRRWMEIDRSFRTWQERLRTALNQWQVTEWDEGGLLRGATLAEAEEWLTQRADNLSPNEQDFILRSVSLRQQQQATAEVERQRQLAHARTLAETERQRAETERLRATEQAQAATQLRRRAWGLGAALILLLLAIMAALIFNQNVRILERQVWTAGERRATAEFLADLAEQKQVAAVATAGAAEATAGAADSAAKVAATGIALAVAAEKVADLARQEAENDRDTVFETQQAAMAARDIARNLQLSAEQARAKSDAARRTAVANEAVARSAEQLAVQAQETAQANRDIAQTRRVEAEVAMQEAQAALATAE